MAQIRAEIKRGMLRAIFTASQASAGGDNTDQSDGSAFKSALDYFQAKCFQSVGSGRVVASISGNGRQTTFQLPSAYMAFSEPEVMALSEEYEQVYADALVTLANAGNASPQDTDVFATMMVDDRLQTITEVMKDYSLLRYPSRL